MRIACTRNMRCSKPHCTTLHHTTKTNLDRISFVEKSIYAHQIRINDLDLLVSVSSPYHFITLQFCCLFCCCYCGRRYFILFILLLFVVWTRAHKFPSRFVYVNILAAIYHNDRWRSANSTEEDHNIHRWHNGNAFTIYIYSIVWYVHFAFGKVTPR